MLRTSKAVSKRVKVTKSGKLKRRMMGQNHYKAKLSGRANQKRRRSFGFAKVDLRAIKKHIPYR